MSFLTISKKKDRMPVYVYGGLQLLDLIQEKSVGLIEAVDRFEVQRGYKLST